MEFHHPSVLKGFPLYAHVSQEPQAEQIPHGSSPSLPIVPQLEQRVSDSLFTFQLAQHQSSHGRVLSDITNITPNFSNELIKQKVFFPAEIEQKFETHAQNNIENCDKPGPIMVMDQYSLSSIPRTESLLIKNDTKSIDPQVYMQSLETVGTSLEELRSPPSEKVNQKLHDDVARPSHSIWSSVSHIEDREVPFDTTEIQETKNIFTFETKRSSRKETAALLNEIENLFEEEEGISLDIRQTTVFKNLLNDLQKNKVRVTRIKVETVVGRVRTHRSSLSKDLVERGSEKPVNKVPHELDIDIEGVQSHEEQQAGASDSKMDFQKMKDELAHKFEELKEATKELLEPDNDIAEKLESSEKIPTETAAEAMVPDEEANQVEFEGEKITGLDKQENEPGKEDNSLEEARGQVEIEKTDEKFLEQETFLEKDEINKRALEEPEETTKTIQDQETEVIEAKEKDQRPSAWMAKLVTVGIAGLLVVILWYQLQEELKDL